MIVERALAPLRRFGIVLLALALAAVPAAAGPLAWGDLTASAVLTTGTSSQVGSMSMLHAARPDATEPSFPDLRIEAERLEWTRSEEAGPALQAPSPTGGDDAVISPGTTPRLARHSQQDATFATTGAQAQFLLHILALEPLQVGAVTESTVMQAVQQPYLSKSLGIVEWEEGHPINDPADPNPSDFTQTRAEQRMVRTLAGGATELTLRGDFILEFWGLSGTVTADGTDHDVQSGTSRDPIAPGAPSGMAYQEQRSFVRMLVHQGSATFTFDAGMQVQWAGPATELSLTAPVLLDGALGHITTQEGEAIAVRDAEYTLAGRNLVLLEPRPTGLHLAVTGLDEEGQPLRVAAPSERLPQDLVASSTWLLVALAIIATGLVAWRRLRRPIGMPDIEGALAAGAYRRAARLSSRLLRRSPGLETAVISRAIALSKGGKSGQAAREVEAHLRHRPATDGVLHYVLGVAYGDLGRADDADRAFQEALRLTPSLFADVQSRLPSGSRIPAVSTKAAADAHGYA